MTPTLHRIACRPAALLALALMLVPASLAAQDETGAPLSAIEWLDQALATPLPEPNPDPEPPSLPALSDTPGPDAFEPITAIPLETVEIDATGLFRAERIGLPRSFWGPTPLPEILEAVADLPQDTLPGAMRLGLRVLMAEFAPPWSLEPDERGQLLQARVEQLMAQGALEQAGQLIEAAPERTASLSALGFDIALLLGEEDRACAQMRGQITPAFGQAAQIFCTARGGDWQAAHASLAVARSLGLVSPTEAQLLTRFLEEEEEETLLPPPQEMTPLAWRIMEALGDPVVTATLPVAYAHADLRGTSGWRAQLDAAERLTRAGVMQPNRLLGLYTERRAAASGGLWERVRAMQALEQAISARDPGRTGEALLAAWPLFVAVELEQPFAEMVATDLADMPLNGPAAKTLWKLLLLAQAAPERAAQLAPQTDLARFVMALAGGNDLPALSSPALAEAIGLAYDPDAMPEALAAQVEAGALGRILFDAFDNIADAAAGDLHAATRALQRLRALGLEQEARQIGVELLLLERRG